MKNFIVLLLFIASSVYVSAQRKDPYYHHAVSIEHSYIPGIFLYGYFLPDNIEYSLRISKKVYLQAGLFAQNAEEVPGESFFKTGFAVYSGATMKFFLFRNNGFLAGSFYFTPSLNLYADYYGPEYSLYDWTFTLGPTVAAEYIFSDRVSLRFDAINVNLGIGFPYGDFVGTVHRFLGLGVRYNFGLK